ncbi:MAG: hypothetical protein ABIH25_00710 [Candidatus Woesearchaeota archaeon]
MVYKQVKSKFIKDKIRGLRWNKKNVEYVDNLVFIEDYILDKTAGLGVGYKINSFKNKYKKEYEEIYKELRPKEFKQVKKRKVKERKKEEKENRKFDEDKRKEEEQAKKEWLEMGGK